LPVKDLAKYSLQKRVVQQAHQLSFCQQVTCLLREKLLELRINLRVQSCLLVIEFSGDQTFDLSDIQKLLIQERVFKDILEY
jgi:hypothetical protein